MTRTTEFTPRSTLESTHWKWLGIDSSELEFFDLGRQLFDNWRESGQSLTCLRLRGEAWKMVDFQEAPPLVEVQHLMKLLKEGNSDQISIADLLVCMDQLGGDMRLNPLSVGDNFGSTLSQTAKTNSRPHQA